MTRELDYDKFKKEAGQFSNELKSLKTRQTDLEKITKIIYGQNSILLKENKLLWSELIKNKEKYERKVEKLMLFVISMLQASGMNKNAITAGGKKGLDPADLSETLESFGEDQLDNNTALSVIPEKKDHDKFFKKLTKYFQTKGNKTKIDKLLELAQNPSFNGNPLEDQPESNNDWNFENDQPRIQNPRNPLKRNAPSSGYGNDIAPEDLMRSQGSKHVKLEPENEFGNQNFLAQENQELPNLDLFKAPSTLDPNIDFDLDQASLKPFDINSRQTSIIPYNDSQFANYNYSSNQKNIIPQDFSGAPINSYDKELFAFEPGMNMNMNVNDREPYSPSAFINGEPGFGFDQSALDESFEANKKFE